MLTHKPSLLGIVLTSLSFACCQALYAGSTNDPEAGGSIESSAIVAAMHANGSYHVAVKGTDWDLEGSLAAGFRVLPASSGNDHLGRYRELSAKSAGGRAVSIRVYDGRPIVYFQETWERGGDNDNPFPKFASLPADASRYSFKDQAFAHYEFGALNDEGPWIFFKGSHAAVLSPADHYQISQMQPGRDGSAASSINAKISSLPEGFTHGTVLAAGTGVNAAMNDWGLALQDLGGKHSRANENDTDPVMTKLGYWTDNGASYYYKFDSKLGYAGTLTAVKESFEKAEIELGYMQLDSWFYPKGTPPAWDKAGGELPFGEDVYRADKQLFPEGLAAFHQQLGLPLVTHARWVSPTSPYRRDFKMSGNVVVDARFWEETGAYLKDSGVATYEQDWLDHNATTELNVTDPSAFLDNMAVSMKRHDLTMQYCMATPSIYMASSQYGNLASIRTSDDRFERERWDAFLYDGRMATALGAQPWTDVFMSHETGNLLIATLSGGPVGVGDALGSIDAENLKHALNFEGEILKPEVGLHPIDRIYAEDAAGEQAPMVAFATSGPARYPDAYYVFAYPRKADDAKATVSLEELGIKTGAVAYDWVRKTVVPIPQGGSVSVEFAGESHDGGTDKAGSLAADRWGYVVVVPYAGEGVALLGDPDKFATLAADWAIRMVRPGYAPAAVIDFGDDKRPRTLAGYATHRPEVESKDATAALSSYNADTGFFLITVNRKEAERALVSVK